MAAFLRKSRVIRTWWSIETNRFNYFNDLTGLNETVSLIELLKKFKHRGVPNWVWLDPSTTYVLVLEDARMEAHGFSWWNICVDRYYVRNWLRVSGHVPKAGPLHFFKSISPLGEKTNSVVKIG